MCTSLKNEWQLGVMGSRQEHQEFKVILDNITFASKKILLGLSKIWRQIERLEYFINNFCTFLPNVNIINNKRQCKECSTLKTNDQIQFIKSNGRIWKEKKKAIKIVRAMLERWESHSRCTRTTHKFIFCIKEERERGAILYHEK